MAKAAEAAGTRCPALRATGPATHRVARGVVVVLAAWLAGCATTRPPPTVLPGESQESLLRDLRSFSLDGRAVVKSGEESFQVPTLFWRQGGDESLLRLSGPLNAGGLTVTWRPGSLRLAGSHGELYENAEAEAVLLREIGFVPPFDALRYWMLGLPAPGEAPSQRTAASGEGRLGELTQSGWRILYEQWMNVAADGGAVQLPRRLTATREDLRLRVVVDKWKL